MADQLQHCQSEGTCFPLVLFVSILLGHTLPWFLHYVTQITNIYSKL